MQKQDRFFRRMERSVELWEEPLGMQSLVELSGENRVLVEKHRGIRCYRPDKICVYVSYGQIAVCGCDMELSHLRKDQLVIKGKIESIAIIRRQE